MTEREKRDEEFAVLLAFVKAVVISNHYTLEVSPELYELAQDPSWHLDLGPVPAHDDDDHGEVWRATVVNTDE